GIDVLRVEGNREPLFLALQSLGEVTASLGEIKHGAPFRTRMLESNINAAIRARAALGTEPSDEWSAVRDHLEKLARIIADTSNQIRQEVGSDRLARALVEAGVNRPLAFSALARMLIQEGYLEGKMGNVPAQRELETRALKWIDEGMKLIPPEGIVEEKDEKKSERQKAERERRILEIIDLHAAAIEIQISRGEKEAEIKPHLDALDQLKHPRATAISSVQKAAIEMRAGRFAAARAFLETALKTPRSADLRPRALILLANVYLTTQQSSEAAVVLKELEKIYTKIEKMSPAEAAWIMEFLRDPQELALLSVVADLEIATEKLNRSRAKRSVQQSPVVPITTEEVDIVRADQDAAARSIKRLKAPSDANRLARTMIFNYFLRTGQRGKAEAELKSLKAEYPRSVEVLRAEVTFSILPAPGDKIDADSAKLRVKKTDDLILAFQSENPNDAAVKRFWAEWLIRTSRTEEALAYLENPLNFPGERDEATKRVLAVALLNRGDRDRGQKLLLELPRDASIEALLIRTTANPETRQQLLEKAVIKHESNGQFQVWKGEQLLADGKHLEAADVFWKAREYTRVGDAARMGLLRSLLGLADTDPAKVLDAVAKYSAESKDEAILYSIAAFAALRRDEIGTEADVWPGTKTMWAALNRWRERATKSGLDAPSIALFLSQFWMLANRPDLAFNTLDLSQQRSEAVLNRLIELALASNDETRRNQTARAAEWTARWRKVAPDDPLPLFESIRQDLVAGRLEKAQNEAEIFLAESAERAEKRLTKSDVPSLEKRRQERLKDLRAYTLISYAQTWQQAGQLDGAEAFVTRALREQPQNMAALLFEAQIALARKDWAKARDLYKSILEKDKENYVAHVNLAWVLAEHFNQSAENMTESLKLVRRVMKEPTNPQDPPKEKPIAVERLSPEFLDTLGKVYREAALQKVEPGLYGKMEKVFRDASRQFPSDPRMQLHLAEAHVGLADRVRATQEYEKALALAREGKGPFSETERREFIQKILDRMKGL
ncbi:MAG: tetratricopeptide repeat protein, partial [Planctomycetes bacterium]|nr:tetratricopeptide repeat protein [Planctomycetota bacterium]